MDRFLEAAVKLHRHILDRHWKDGMIVGPDPIGKIHWRVTRFIRSYLAWLPGDDRYTYMQGQAYWIRGNSSLFGLTQDSKYLELLSRAADRVAQAQLSNNAWEHPPIRGRRGFVSTVETVWACLGLVASYRDWGNAGYLDAALKGHDALLNVIGLRPIGDGLAVNYYAHSAHLVPNVTTMFLWLLGELWQVTGEDRYLEHAPELLRFLEASQMANGELEYVYRARPHFQCYQYNSFQFLDLAHYFQITGDQRVRTILTKLASYLATGVTARGSCRYSCFKEAPEVSYWGAALAAALRTAHELQLGDYLALSERAYAYPLMRQRADGGFRFSERNYGLLRDERSYPRYLAMILCHLLYRADLNRGA